ncbi:hypothetical protein ACFLTW_05095 [Chloroflexota bacterium]
MEENMENPLIPPYSLGRKDRSTSLWVDNGDKMILTMYKESLKCTMTAVLHYLIGIGARCYEEKHDKEIALLEEKVRTQANIIVAYIKKYG